MTNAPTFKRLPDRRASETFNLQCAGLSYVATISRFDDGRIGEIWPLIPLPATPRLFARSPLQFGADVETIRKALCRDGSGNASGPLGVALDRLEQQQNQWEAAE